jgi:malate dehydrogenase (oxaloacetate-decarboxylating)(NADP+)
LRRRPIADLEAYGQRLLQFVYHSGTLMQPIFAAARALPAQRSRIVYAEGEDERVLRAVQIAVDEKLATPILVGRPAVIEGGIKRHGLRIRLGEHFTVVNPETRCAISRVLAGLSQAHRTQRRDRAIREAGDAPPHHVDCRDASEEGRSRRTDLRDHQHHRAAPALHRSSHRPAAWVTVYGAMSGLILPGRQVFIVDTHVNLDPSAEQLAEITRLAADQLCAFGLTPKVACCRIRISAAAMRPRR